MEHSFNIAKRALCKKLVKIISINVVGNLQVSQVFELVAHCQIINCNDVVDTPRIQALYEVAADKASSACYNNFHS